MLCVKKKRIKQQRNGALASRGNLLLGVAPWRREAAPFNGSRAGPSMRIWANRLRCVCAVPSRNYLLHVIRRFRLRPHFTVQGVIPLSNSVVGHHIVAAVVVSDQAGSVR